MKLYNHLSAKENTLIIDKSQDYRITLSFYKYVFIGNPLIFRNYLYVKLNNLGVLGRIFVANEGINAQLSCPEKNLSLLESEIEKITFLNGIRLNFAIEHHNKSFLKLKIKIKNKIIADGITDKLFNPSLTGKHLNAIDFNKITSNKDTLIVDMRNHYESEIGKFKNAITPNVDTFRQSLPLVEKKLSKLKKSKNFVMYCTGGIRCEKASAYLKFKGFSNVYQLKGGIIEYTRQVRKLGIENKFIGKNFVFDDRRSEEISTDIISKCHQCGGHCDTHTNCLNEACHLLFIQCDKCAEKFTGCCSHKCAEISSMPVTKQKLLRRGMHNSNKIFKKARSKHLLKNKYD